MQPFPISDSLRQHSLWAPLQAELAAGENVVAAAGVDLNRALRFDSGLLALVQGGGRFRLLALGAMAARAMN
jgi:hypothetical protein